MPVTGEAGCMIPEGAARHTSVHLAAGLRLDLLTPTLFRLRRSTLRPEPFPPAYEVPFAMAPGVWAPVAHERIEGPMTVTVRTERLVIIIQPGCDQMLVEDAASGRRLYPTTAPRYGLCRNGCMVFDSAGAPDEPTTCSRHAHWFFNPATGLYDQFLATDALYDLFFIHGPDYPALFAQFNRLVGPEPLLPRKGYGFHQTQHLGCAGSAPLLLRTVEEFRRRGLPLDTVIIDFEWGDGCDGSAKVPWGSRLAWSESYARPLAPRAWLAALAEQHVEAMVIHHSVPDYPNRSGEAWVCRAYPAGDWWAALQEKLGEGVVGTWQDTRRSDITDARIYTELQSRLGPGRRATFLGNYELFQDCNWTRHTHPLPSQSLIGNRRTAFHWTGDKSNDRWSELRFQVESIINRHGAMRGLSHLCDDMMRSGDWRLAVRSLQFHCLSTLARSHNLKPWQVHGSFEAADNMAITGNPGAGVAADCPVIPSDRLLGLDRPHAGQEALFRRFLGLRYRLLPYLYTQVHLGWREGMPVCRPLLMAFPDDPACKADQWPAQYLLGPDLLVAPVVDDGDYMTVYLPQGADWIDFWTGVRFAGGQSLRVATDDLSRLPLFVRQGAMIPMQEPGTWIESGQVPDPLHLEIWPSRARTTGLLIEDDGLSLDYQKGLVAETAFVCRWEEDDCLIEILPVQGGYPSQPPVRRYHLRIHGFTHASDTVFLQPSGGACTVQREPAAICIELAVAAAQGITLILKPDR